MAIAPCITADAAQALDLLGRSAPDQRLHCYRVQVRSPGQLWVECGYVLEASGPRAIAFFRPDDAPDYWEYRAELVEPVNGALLCLLSDPHPGGTRRRGKTRERG